MMKRRFLRPAVPILGLLLLLSLPVLAVAVDDDDDDRGGGHFFNLRHGVVEINQYRALRGRVTPGDKRGFPVTIARPGSYKLTGNLTVSDPHVDAIEIVAENVTLDLNGFSILGPGTGSGRGVFAAGYSNVNVRNGSIVDMGSHGMELDIAASVDHVNALDNGGSGVFTQGGSAVTHTTSNRNEGSGIDVGIGSTIADSNANRNGGDGIATGARSTVRGNTANVNGGDGVQASQRSVVTGNAASENGGYGLLLGVGVGYNQNVLSGNNNRGPNVRNFQVTGGISLGRNICGNSTNC